MIARFSRRQFLAHSLAAGAVALLPLAASTEAEPSITGPNSLRAHASARGLLLGTAVDLGILQNDPAYARLLAEQYNLVVGESAMKWAALRPAPDRYDFTGADALVAFAEAHGMKVRGHNFVWHQALPAWFTASVIRGNARQFLLNHIDTVGRRYAGRLHSWDVVNEVLDEHSSRPDLLRTDSPWFELLGPGYVETAFRAARRADQHALLTLNEYGVEYDFQLPKRTALLALLRRLKAARVPLDAVGIQSHLSAGTKNAIGPGIRAFTEQAAALGLQVFITELDVNDDQIPSMDASLRDQAVAAVYRDYLGAMLSEPAVKAVLTWGITDKATWLNTGKTHLAAHPERPERPLPFDEQYRPTPAFFALRDALDLATRPATPSGHRSVS